MTVRGLRVLRVLAAVLVLRDPEAVLVRLVPWDLRVNPDFRVTRGLLGLPGLSDLLDPPELPELLDLPEPPELLALPDLLELLDPLELPDPLEPLDPPELPDPLELMALQGLPELPGPPDLPAL